MQQIYKVAPALSINIRVLNKSKSVKNEAEMLKK